jgi:hypothetical protein
MRPLRLLLVACALVIASPAAPARAADTPDEITGVHLAYQSPWVNTRGQFTMLLQVDNPGLAARPGAAISIRVHQSASTRTSFDNVIAGELGRILYEPDPIPVALIPRWTDGSLAITLGLSGSQTEPSIGVSRAGVYPVEVSLTNTGTPTSSFVTWLVVVPAGEQPVDEPLMLASIWQVVANPARRDANGTPDGPEFLAQIQRGGRLDRIASLLDESGRFPASLVIGPETVESWSAAAKADDDVASGFAKVRTAARRTSTNLLPVPYVPMDGPVLEAAGRGAELPGAYVAGGQTLDAVLGASPFDSAQTAFVDPADDATVDRLRDMQAPRVAVRESALVPITHPRTPAESFALVTAGGRSQAVATAPFVEQLLEGDDPPALKAQRVIAALAEIAYELPAVRRGIVLSTPSNWNPDVEAMTALVEGISNFPLVAPVKLDELFTRISSEQIDDIDVERRLQPSTPPAAPLSSGELAAAANRLRAYEAVVGRDDPIIVKGKHALVTAASTAASRPQALADIADIDRAVADFTSAVTVDAKRVTLTARRASVPISFENNLVPPRRVQVRVHFDSPKLLFPDGRDQVITLEPGRNTVEFMVEARASGTFPMEISLSSADGQLDFGAPVRVSVRSAVFGRLAVFLTIGALAFLALWWGNHFRRTRRARRTPAPAMT